MTRTSMVASTETRQHAREYHCSAGVAYKLGPPDACCSAHFRWSISALPRRELKHVNTREGCNSRTNAHTSKCGLCDSPLRPPLEAMSHFVQHQTSSSTRFNTSLAASSPSLLVASVPSLDSAIEVQGLLVPRP